MNGYLAITGLPLALLLNFKNSKFKRPRWTEAHQSSIRAISEIRGSSFGTFTANHADGRG